jgi:parallel beta-helix repeat protein
MNKNIFLILLGLIFLVGIMGGVLGVNCNADLSNIGNGCFVPSSLTLNGSYVIYSNGSNAGAIIINGNNVVIDGNGTTLIGNATSGLYGISYSGIKSNITIKNFIVKNYDRNMLFKGTNYTIQDNSLGYSLRQSLYMSGLNFSLIKNNTFLNGTLLGSNYLYLDTNSDNNTIILNNFTSSLLGAGIRLVSGRYNNIANNYFGFNDYGIYLSDSSANNTFINNNIFYNSSFSNIWLLTDSNKIINNSFFMDSKTNYNIYTGRVFNNIILNNSFILGNGIYLFNSSYNNISSNKIFTGNYYPILYSIYFAFSSNNTFEGNYLFNATNILALKFGSSYNNIYLNHWYNCTVYYCSLVTYNSSFNVFDSNVFDINSIAIQLDLSATETLIKNNLFNNSVTNYDAWNTPINFMKPTYNTTILNNSFNNVGCQGILSLGANGLSIINNSFNKISLANSIGKVNCHKEMPVAIGLQELYITYLGTSDEDFYVENYTRISSYKNYNVNISGNSFSGFDLLLRSQGTVNLMHDLVSFWFRSFRFPTYLLDRDDLYININSNNVSGQGGSNSNLSGIAYTTVFSQGYDGIFTSNYSFFKDYSYFKNINGSNYSGLELYNLSNSLVVYDNGTSIPIYGTNQAYNLTLEPNQYVYVYNTLTIDERNPIANYPIYFSSSSSTSKTITANLSSNVTASVILTADCSNINELIITTPTTTQTLDWNEFTCNGFILPLTLRIEPGNTTIELLYTSHQAIQPSCQNVIGGLGAGSIWISILIVTLFAVAVLGMIIKQEDKFQSPVQFHVAIIGTILAGITLVIGIYILEMICKIA